MRQWRTIYFNDARHYHLFVFEPPMTLQDAQRPVDEVAGTGVDTFAYGVARNDGLFYPTAVGRSFMGDVERFDHGMYWRVRRNIRSLRDRGLDLLQILIDRAHQKGMEFFASFRMGSYLAVEPREVPAGRSAGSADPAKGGRGLAEAHARESQFRVLEELATRYDVDGLELDFAGVPGGSPAHVLPEDIVACTPVLTEHVRRISNMVRRRGGGPGRIGVRVPPVESFCLAQAVDVSTWLNEGLIDYVVPLHYAYQQADPQMPIDWLIDAAHAADAAVYGMIQPFTEVGLPSSGLMEHVSSAVLRAVASNFIDRGADGLYTWFMAWPLGTVQRGMLSEIADPSLMEGRDRTYTLTRRQKQSADLGYDHVLPLEIPEADERRRYTIPINIADDVEAAADRVGKVTLRLRIWNTVSADRYSLILNGRSLDDEPVRRDVGMYLRAPHAPHVTEYYSSQWIEIDLNTVRPRRGQNILEISLTSRPEGLYGGVAVHDVELRIDYRV